MKITGKTFDIKVGYTCNNHCLHCVIEPNKEKALSSKKKIDASFRSLIDTINEKDVAEAESLVLTGGEITIRRDFIRILEYIYRKYPNKYVNIQTNGRELGKYVEKIKSISDNINFTIAIHSMDEDIHNAIVNNKQKNSNPFKETMNSIDKIKEVYGSFNDSHRVELVLSNKNKNDLSKTIETLVNLGIYSIGISYPHLDGFYAFNGVEKVKEIGFPYSDLKSQIPKIVKIANQNKNVALMFEEFPPCIWRDKDGVLYKNLPNNIMTLGSHTEESTSVKYPDQEDANLDFGQTWINMHKYTKNCQECILKEKKECLGIWEESKAIWNGKGLIPIKKEEL